ncbi:hypothetical protein WJX72_011151 [[Myrmecia] bisecta]|uniref:DJ-1/PfpI domain-containing protein n=1 Tax=[Myrmecia] bisecta TaxID=41462 RepID=A0AAW1R9C5_9CHLO
MAPNVVILCTSTDTLPNKAGPTGAWAEEAITPYYVFKDAGYRVTFASVNGGAIPWEPKSLTKDFITPCVEKFLKEENGLVENTVRLASLDADDHDAIYLAGGCVFDFYPNDTLANLVSSMWAKGKGVSGVCHGPAGLLGAREDGKPAGSLVAGKHVTGFSNSEQKNLTDLWDVLPYSLENRLKQLGAKYEAGPDMSVFVVADGRLITGQNPPSSGETARKLVKVIRREA